MSDTGTISMRGWEKHQHYKNRNPPWIKIHKDLLNDYDFSCLQTASKAHVVLMWVLASQMDNRIPADAKWIASRIGCDKDKIDIKGLIAHGFIRDDSNVLADCKQSAIAETETELETETEHWSKAFDRWWSEYPKKVGKKPCRAIWKRIKPDADGLIYDVKQRIEMDDQWRRGFIPNPQTYLNQERWQDEIIQAKPSEYAKPDIQSQSFKTFDPDADVVVPGPHTDQYEDMK